MLDARLDVMSVNAVHTRSHSQACYLQHACCSFLICSRLQVSTHRNKLSSHGGAAATAKPLRVAVMHWGQIAALDWNNDAVLASGSCGSCKVNQLLLVHFRTNCLRHLVT